VVMYPTKRLRDIVENIDHLEIATSAEKSSSNVILLSAPSTVGPVKWLFQRYTFREATHKGQHLVGHQSPCRPNFHRKEIDRCQQFQVRADELSHAIRFPRSGAGAKSPLQQVADRLSTDLYPRLRAGNSPV
jgi:hypothetical protein